MRNSILGKIYLCAVNVVETYNSDVFTHKRSFERTICLGDGYKGQNKPIDKDGRGRIMTFKCVTG